MDKVDGYKIRKMSLGDIPAVLEIDRQSFALPWSEHTYRQELIGNHSTTLFVAEIDAGRTPTIIGYVGYWLMIDEMHISTLAVSPAKRRMGVGSSLLANALKSAARHGVVRVSLEVRKTNSAAIDLYKKIGFKSHARKPNYYRDNGEDALVLVLYDVVKWAQEVREA